MKLHYFGEDLNILGEEKYKKKKKTARTHRHTDTRTVYERM